jgi:hypothetical protein
MSQPSGHRRPAEATPRIRALQGSKRVSRQSREQRSDEARELVHRSLEFNRLDVTLAGAIGLVAVPILDHELGHLPVDEELERLVTHLIAHHSVDANGHERNPRSAPDAHPWQVRHTWIPWLSEIA